LPWSAPWLSRWWSRRRDRLAAWLARQAPDYQETERLTFHLLIAGLMLVVLVESVLLILKAP